MNTGGLRLKNVTELLVFDSISCPGYKMKIFWIFSKPVLFERWIINEVLKFHFNYILLSYHIV